jgi:hypothetical protein
MLLRQQTASGEIGPMSQHAYPVGDLYRSQPQRRKQFFIHENFLLASALRAAPVSVYVHALGSAISVPQQSAASMHWRIF